MKKNFSLIIDDTSNTEANAAARIHYRSKLYTSKIGVNPLVTAAHPLFSILERINLSEKPPELSALEANLSHELQAFMTKASTSEHMDETILAARYLLCATIDEVIDKAYDKHAIIDVNETAEDSASHLIEKENAPLSGETHFFKILDKAMTKPDFYLDVIELTYFCIITGFEGKYRRDPNGKQQLENLLDKLYQIIQNQKPATPEKLFMQPTPTKRFISIKLFPWKWFIGILAGITITGYFIAVYQLNQHAKETFEQTSQHAVQRNY